MVPGLAIVRQLEAVGFRAWPAASVYYDGTWAIRMTAAYPSRRLNSINPLDPGDTRDIPKRVELAVRRFRAHGRVPCVRVSPLAPPALEAYLEGLGWKRKHETIVMTADLAAMDLLKAVDRASLEDIGHFVDASLSIHERPEELRSGFSQLLKSIHSNRGMFVLEEGGRAVSNVLCVQDGAMAGLFDVATLRDVRRKGHGRDLVASALKWAAKLGAGMAWLQIEADNVAGLALYERFGFQEAYGYAYRENSLK